MAEAQAQRHSWSGALPVGGTIAADPSTTDALSRLSALLDAQHHGVPVGFRVEDRSGEFASLGPSKPRVLKFDPNLGENGAFYFVDIDQMSPGGSPPGQQPSLTVPTSSPPQAAATPPRANDTDTHTTTTFAAQMESKTELTSQASHRDYFSSSAPRSSRWVDGDQSNPDPAPQQPVPSAPPLPTVPEHFYIPSTTEFASPIRVSGYQGSTSEQPRSPTQRLPAKRPLQSEHLGVVDFEAQGDWLGGLAGEAPFASTNRAEIIAGDGTAVPAATTEVSARGRHQVLYDPHSFASTVESAMPVHNLSATTSNTIHRSEEEAAGIGVAEPSQEKIQPREAASQLQSEWAAAQSSAWTKDTVAALGSTTVQRPVSPSFEPVETQTVADMVTVEPTPAGSSDEGGEETVVRQPQSTARHDGLLTQTDTIGTGEVTESSARAAITAQSSTTFSPTSTGPTMRYVTDLSGFDESLIDLVSEVESMDLGSPRSSLGALDANNLEFAGRSARAAKPPLGSSLRRTSGATGSPPSSSKPTVQWPVSQQASPLPTPHQTQRVASWLRGSIYEENDIVSTIMEAEELGRSLLTGGFPTDAIVLAPQHLNSPNETHE
jgi:hypothetical protein